MAKDKFNRTKIHMNVGTIGHVDHGKTTLSAAITMYCKLKYGDKVMKFDDIDNVPDKKACGITINTRRLEYQSDKQHYAHIDCSGYAEHIKNMSTGVAQMNSAVLDVFAPNSVMLLTREHIILNRQVGVAIMIVFLEVGQLEEIIKNVLTRNNSPGVKAPIIKDFSLNAMSMIPEASDIPVFVKCIKELLVAMALYFPDPVYDSEKPFLMPIKDVFTISGQSTVVTEKIDCGIEKNEISQSAKSIVTAVQKAGAKVTDSILLPTRINKRMVLRSPYVNKKSREQFEMRTHKQLIENVNFSQHKEYENA